MQDSSEAHSGENRVSLEKNVKRTLKTPEQLRALEEFYNEHKYPSEELKSELSERIGLSEKQISSWFCHRRLKDKKRDETRVSGRQDRSSSVIQDHGSGLRQDSCGSTKQGDYRTLDPREVDSERLYKHDFPATKLTHNHASRHTGNVSTISELSPQSSPPLQEKYVSPCEDPSEVVYSRYRTQNREAMPPIPKSGDGMNYRPSGYLKVRGDIENAAITAVKRQLGRHYRKDGPPLGVVFDPLPPGAFDSPSEDLGPEEPLYAGDQIRSQSPDDLGTQKQSSLSTRYDVHTSMLGSQDSYLEGVNSVTDLWSDSHDMKSYRQLERNSAHDNYLSSKPSRKSIMDNQDDFDCDVFRDKRKYQTMSSKHDVEQIRSDSVPKSRVLDGRKFHVEQKERWLHDYDNGSPPTFQKNDYMSKPSNLVNGSTVQSEERPFHVQISREERACKQKKGAKEYRDPVKVGQRSRFNFPLKGHATNESLPKIPQTTNAAKRSIMQKPSSFGNNEAAETSSSGEWEEDH